MPHCEPGCRQRRCSLQDLGDRVALLPAQTHEHPRHQREVEAHVALGAILAPEVVDDVLRPLVGLRQQHPVAPELAVQGGAQLGDERVRLGEVLAVGPLPLEQVGDGVQPEAVNPQVEPEAADVHHLLADLGVVVVEVGLMAEEAVKVVGLSAVIPGPVRGLGVDEDDPGIGVAVLGLRPDVVVAVRGCRRRACRLEPGMLIGGVVEDQVHHHPHAHGVGLSHQLTHVVDGAVGGEDGVVVPDVVAAVAQGEVVEGQQPETVDTQPAQVLEALDQAREVADPVVVAVGEAAHQHLVEDGALEPERVLLAGCGRHGRPHPPGGGRRAGGAGGRAGAGWAAPDACGRGGCLAHRSRRWRTWAGWTAGSSRT